MAVFVFRKSYGLFCQPIPILRQPTRTLCCFCLPLSTEVLFMSLIHLLHPSIALLFTLIIDAAKLLQIQCNTFMGEQYLL